MAIQCPNCKHAFEENEETFWWSADENNDPCVENIRCPECLISTQPAFSCEICPGRSACELEEECAPCMSASYDEFIEVKVIDNKEGK